jgi:uncharacterized protein
MRRASRLRTHMCLTACLYVGMLLCAPHLPAQAPDWRTAAEQFQAELVRQYADTAETPLRGDERLHFTGLEFFPIRNAYYVAARFERTPDAVPFEMPTVSGKTKTFVQYGILHFRLHGKALHLAAYQNLKIAALPAYADDLFIPFRDASSGGKSYGGGRYIDIKIPQTEQVWLDFNQCYNPYCAYSKGWNCPIPPADNYLAAKVHAGVRAYTGSPAH